MGDVLPEDVVTSQLLRWLSWMTTLYVGSANDAATLLALTLTTTFHLRANMARSATQEGSLAENLAISKFPRGSRAALLTPFVQSHCSFVVGSKIGVLLVVIWPYANVRIGGCVFACVRPFGGNCESSALVMTHTMETHDTMCRSAGSSFFGSRQQPACQITREPSSLFFGTYTSTWYFL